MLPYFTRGVIIKGFGRGSKQLGFPTANFADEVTDGLPGGFECGVYHGWAMVDRGPVHGMVMSVGYNPFYGNTKKTMETHILHEFPGDLYGSMLTVCIAGYIRPERNFDCIDALIAAINEDISIARRELAKPAFQQLARNEYFTTAPNTTTHDSPSSGST